MDDYFGLQRLNNSCSVLFLFLFFALFGNDRYHLIYFFLQENHLLSTELDSGPITHYSRNMHFWSLNIFKSFYVYTPRQDKQNEE